MGWLPLATMESEGGISVLEYHDELTYDAAHHRIRGWGLAPDTTALNFDEVDPVHLGSWVMIPWGNGAPRELLVIPAAVSNSWNPMSMARATPWEYEVAISSHEPGSPFDVTPETCEAGDVAAVAFTWDGVNCEEFEGCGCVGADCERIFSDLSQCQDACESDLPSPCDDAAQQS